LNAQAQGSAGEERVELKKTLSDDYIIPGRDEWISALMSDPEYVELINYLTKKTLPNDLQQQLQLRLRKLAVHFYVEDGLLYFRHITKTGEFPLLEVPHVLEETSYGFTIVTSWLVTAALKPQSH